MVRVRQPGLLLGEWACLGALGTGRRHGFAIAKRLGPDGDLGRVWTLSRPLTYRSLGVLHELGLVHAVSEEAGDGPNRTLLSLTPNGRAQLREWLLTPVTHPRDVRSELLLKLILCEEIGPDLDVARDDVLRAQHELFAAHYAQRVDEAAADGDDPVLAWRAEFAGAALRFVETLRRRSGATPPSPPASTTAPR